MDPGWYIWHLHGPHLTDIGNQHGTPHSMSFVDILCGEEKSNDKLNHAYLPMAVTKRKVYRNFVFTGGYKIKSDRNGHYSWLYDYPI